MQEAYRAIRFDASTCHCKSQRPDQAAVEWWSARNASTIIFQFAAIALTSPMSRTVMAAIQPG